MQRGRVVDFRRPNVASVFLLVIGLLVSSLGLTYWLGLEANASNRKLADLRLVIERWIDCLAP